MNLYNLNKHELHEIEEHLKSLAGNHWHKMHTPFGIAYCRRSLNGLIINWQNMKLFTGMTNTLKFIDKDTSVDFIGSILNAFDNSDVYLNEIVYLISKETFQMQENNLHLSQITDYLFKNYALDISGISENDNEFQKYNIGDYSVNMFRNGVQIEVEVYRFLRK